jgi:hypothetical protein
MGEHKILFILGAGLGTLLIVLLGSFVISRIFIARHIRKLIRSVGREQLPHFSAALVAPLPEPIQRYLKTVLKEGQPNIRYADLRQEATFRHRENSPWFSVKAREVISGMEPGFVWDALLRHSALWWRTAKLSYFQGRGSGHIKLYGVLPLQELEGHETDTSMLFRFLSELVWLPTGLLPTKTLRWEPLDENSARAVIRDGETTSSAIFHVGADGYVERVVTTDKFRDLKSGFERHTFSLVCREWKPMDGVTIPTEVDFVWNFEKGDFLYGRFKIVDAIYHLE